MEAEVNPLAFWSFTLLFFTLPRAQRGIFFGGRARRSARASVVGRARHSVRAVVAKQNSLLQPNPGAQGLTRPTIPLDFRQLGRSTYRQKTETMV